MMGQFRIMETEVLIKPAQAIHLDQMRQLFYDTITTVNKKDYTEDQINAWAAGYKDIGKWIVKMKEQKFFVAEARNKLLGFASIAADGCLDYIYIHKDHQREGIATKLLQELEKYVLKSNIEEVWSDVSITAKPFFQSRGFIISEIYVRQLKGVEFTNTIMRKRMKISIDK